MKIEYRDGQAIVSLDSDERRSLRQVLESVFTYWVFENPEEEQFIYDLEHALDTEGNPYV